MKMRLIASLIVAPVILAAALAVPHAQRGAPAAARGFPRTAEGKPDFSGMWDNPKPASGPMRGPATVFDRGKFPRFKPGGEAFYEPRTGDPRHTSRARSACPRGSRLPSWGRIPSRWSRTQSIW